MAFSGTYNFNLDVEELITQALGKVGGEITSGTDLRKARIALNLLLLDLNNREVPLAGMEEKTLQLVKGQATYTLPNDVEDVLSLVLDQGNNIDTPITRIPIREFQTISNKDSPGMPTQCVVTRNLTSTEVRFYLVPNSDDFKVHYWAKSKTQDVGAYSNNVAMVNRYLPALVFGLAYFIGMDREGFPEERLNRLEREYEKLLDNAALEDRERVSFKVTPFGYRRR